MGDGEGNGGSIVRLSDIKKRAESAAQLATAILVVVLFGFVVMVFSIAWLLQPVF